MNFRLRKLQFGIHAKALVISPFIAVLALPAISFAATGKREHAALHYSISPVNSTANAVTITGKVTDAQGPLPGVTVTEKGTTNFAITDVNGNFKLTTKGEGAVLIFSFTGYASKEVTVSGKQVISVVLVEDVKSLNEVVVVGYGTQKKRDVTGAVTSVNIKEIASQPVPDIGQAIEGRAAGVQAITSGSPGSNVTLRIRGIGTINNADPLLVIDGVPTDVPLNTINPDDIASFDVLKDASAAAIYGSRGANGVVLITTKKGNSTQSHLNVNAFYGTQKATNTVQLLNANQFAKLNTELLENNNQSTNPAYADAANLGAGTNWLDALFRNAPIQSYTMSYSGGSEKSDYYVSGSVLDQKGIVISTAYRRYTLQFNGNNRVLTWLKFGNNITLNHDEKPSGSYSIRDAMAANPVQPVFNADGTYSGPVGQPQFYGDVKNPIATANLVKNNTEGYN
ncbi:MAG TPA: SusC/RagA family TonB-linked outer membrane protein, partial [Mucilaginibacter sp.]